MKSRYRQILIFCPDAVSGGPEALHQLADVLNTHGATARMVYYGSFSTLHMEDDVILCGFNPDSPVHAAYRHYDAPPLRHAILDPDTLLVLPEGLIDMATAWLAKTRAALAVWWLSVDNAPLATRPRDEAFEDALFRSRILHFYQSNYACQMLYERRARHLLPLFDFTDRAFVREGLGLLTAEQSIAARGRSIAYYPAKAGAAGQAFMASMQERDPTLTVRPIQGMTKPQVGQTLRETCLFVDFGHSPGKDRVPREALILGSVIMVRRAGAANFFNDYPLDGPYMFSDRDMETGILEERIMAVLDDPARALAGQAGARARIALEYQEFVLQVRQAFFGL